LVLDEPTLGLEDRERVFVMEAVRQLAEFRDLSLLYISHETDERVPGLSHHLTLVPHPKGGYTGEVEELDI
jgi:ABC-type molybdenum transport system ATPase subunit/photorepair protein PhrA